ncbi:hypothetical protein [Actinomadura rugatobispora]|uniref:Lipoprotein n=1 Tax=Actinomadura rugatobispora TaxID=1994 RepID=A0ABW1ACD3_9ACTN|nr:hypothetical protein GCM10010200_075300 [Actinomadura rugatobispora]
MGSLYQMTPVKAALLCGAVIVPLAAGCSGSSGSASHSGHEGPAAKPATIEQLAQKTGCTLAGKRNSAELRQGACQTSRGRYTLVSFTDDKGRDSWLTEAKPWGGSYLVGPRWVAVATPPILESLRKEVGGKIINGDQHHSGG